MFKRGGLWHDFAAICYDCSVICMTSKMSASVTRDIQHLFDKLKTDLQRSMQGFLQKARGTKLSRILL